ncbi:MAG: MarR family transcriptional regulator [Rhizobiaceae bacterium]
MVSANQIKAKQVDAEIIKQRTRLWLKMLKTTRGIENELRRKLQQKFDTTLPRFDVMAALYRSETGMNMSALSKALMVSNGNVTGIVERLVSEGLLLRLQGKEDRRVMLIRLTIKGQELFEKMAIEHRVWVDQLFSQFDFDDTKELMDSFEKIQESELSSNEK